jgi:hypothetical protein
MNYRQISRLKGWLCLGSALLVFGAGSAFADTATGPGFQQVFASPDDVAQNFAYARAEARAGRLLAAAAALERILLVAPNENGVRLFYAAVLYRLDDLQGAQQQLDALDQSTLTPLQKREAEKYRTRISEERSGFKLSGHVVAGLSVDSDPQGALLTQFNFFGAKPVDKKQGETVITSGVLNLSQDLNQDGDLAAFAAASIYSRQSIGGPNADYLDTEANLGINGNGLKSTWEVGAVVRNYQLFDAPYLTEYGGRAAFNWSPNTSLTWIGSFEGVGQSFHEPTIKALVPAIIPGTQNGARFDLAGGASLRLSSLGTFSGMVGYEIKTAGYEPFAYNSPYLDANYHALLGGGAYFDTSGEIRYVDYQKFDAFFLHVRREDMRGSGRMALGAPLSSFWPEKATGDYREKIIVEGAMTYTDRTSKGPIAAYDNIGFEMRLIWNFGDSR